MCTINDKREIMEILDKIESNSIENDEIESYINILYEKRNDIKARYSNMASNDFIYLNDDIIGSSMNKVIDLLKKLKKERDISDIKQCLESQLQLMMQLKIEQQSEAVRSKEQLQQEILEVQLKIQQQSEEVRAKEESNDLICQFRREVNKLRFSLLQQEAEEQTVWILESNKNSWQAQMDVIKELYTKMGPETKINEDIREEYKLIERKFDSVYQRATKDISSFKTPNNSEDIDGIKIPEFNGDISEWTTFYYLFKKSVHENIMIPKVDKMVRLKSLLNGKPLKLINHLYAIEQNYDRAWDIIVENFGDKSVILTNLVDKVLDHRNICCKSVEDIKKLLDTANECMQTLRLSAMNTEDIGPIIARIIIKKLDQEGLLRFELFNINKKSKGMQLLDDVYNFLEVEHRVLQITKKAHHNILHSDEVLAAPSIDEIPITTASSQSSSITEESSHTLQLPTEKTTTESQTFNNLVVGAENSKMNLEKFLPINIIPPGSSNQQILKELYDTPKVGNVFTQKLFPPTPRPADKLVSVIDLDILAGYLNVYWRFDQFDAYYKLRDSRLYDRAWDMLDRVAEDVVTVKLAHKKITEDDCTED